MSTYLLHCGLHLQIITTWMISCNKVSLEGWHSYLVGVAVVASPYLELHISSRIVAVGFLGFLQWQGAWWCSSWLFFVSVVPSTLLLLLKLLIIDGVVDDGDGDGDDDDDDDDDDVVDDVFDEQLSSTDSVGGL